MILQVDMYRSIDRQHVDGVHCIGPVDPILVWTMAMESFDFKIIKVQITERVEA